MNCIFLGLSITSTWGNGHATTYRGLLKELAARGHHVTFLERDVPWYASNREFESAPYCDIRLYTSLDELKDCYTAAIRNADVVVVGSYVPEGIAVGRWVVETAEGCAAFYDIDTPVTLQSLKERRCEYISYDLFPKYQLYLSFTGGPTLKYIEHRLGSPCARALYCSVDPTLYYPERQEIHWDLGYLGTYAPDRQASLTRFLIDVAEAQPSSRFTVAGPQYPADISWPSNLDRIDHLAAKDHRAFYNAQRFTLNVTRQDMVRAGYSPSVRLFEAAACGVPIITDKWPGLSRFFQPYTEILPVSSTEEVASYLRMRDDQRQEIVENARNCVLRFHTAGVRAREFEGDAIAVLERLSSVKRKSRAVLQPSAAALI
ncbi:MAG: glycosyltransferase [Acidobacteriaceae bacterium]|nr:glycosyltransferase [Acidobacteriaceae bacterium]